jgi:hypothetical protein
MITMPETKGKFFSISQSVTIQGVRYHPAICYPLNPQFRDVVEGMVKDGVAKIYGEKMRFISGVAYPVRKPGPARAASRLSSAPAPEVSGKRDVKKPVAALKQPGRKSGRGGYATQETKAREFN